MELQIEKNVPLPAQRQKGSALVAALRAMTVGDSFLWPKVKRNHLSAYYIRFPEMKFSSRSVDEERVRVWRIK